MTYSTETIKAARRIIAEHGPDADLQTIAAAQTAYERTQAGRAARGLPPLPGGLAPLYSN